MVLLIKKRDYSPRIFKQSHENVTLQKVISEKENSFVAGRCFGWLIVRQLRF